MMNWRDDASPAIAAADASYVLCDHGYLRAGWCRDCQALTSQKGLPVLPVLLGVAVVMTVGLIVLYVLDPAMLVQLAALIWLSVVAVLGWIVVGHEHRSGAGAARSRRLGT
jgi:hypothetical protein